MLDGIDRGDEMIVPDPAARQAWALKQDDRPAYDAVMRAQAAKLRGGGVRPRRTVTDEGGNPAKPVRDEDAFDVEAVAAWLREHATSRRAGPSTTGGTPEVRQFPGGASNLTYLLRYPTAT